MHLQLYLHLWSSGAGCRKEIDSDIDCLLQAVTDLLLLLRNLVDQALAGNSRDDVVEYSELHLHSISRVSNTITCYRLQTYLLLRVSGLGTHVRQEGDLVVLDQTGVDIRFIGEDINTGREELSSCISSDLALFTRASSRHESDSPCRCPTPPGKPPHRRQRPERY